MSDPFAYDVFLSHSSKDKAAVRALAERLRKDGLTVWFDEWVLKPGDNIPAKIDEGLERSRVLVLCMSANAFGSDWAQLESGTFRFRDPLNKDRRFIPCVNCDDPDKRILLWDQLEALFASETTKNRVRELQEQSAFGLDTESEERILVGDVISTVALAGQISREFAVSDYGIDMEIEFKDDNYEATGQRLYLQLKSGDSYLRERKRDNVEIFKIKDERLARYWMGRSFPCCW